MDGVHGIDDVSFVGDSEDLTLVSIEGHLPSLFPGL